MTFSIIARSDDGESWGVAVASKFLGVGAVVPAARAGVGAIATQAEANVAYKRAGIAELTGGADAATTLHRLVADDAGRDDRQVGVVDAQGRAATHTGAACFDWAGDTAGPGYAIQGNTLTGPEVVEATEAAWLAGADQPFAHRLLGALQAGDEAGGDRRGRQSAAILVVRDSAGYGGGDDTAVDLRVDDHAAPIAELQRLLALNDLYLTASTDAEKVAVTPDLEREIAERVGALGYRSLLDWVGTENYEMRVARDGSWIDEKILAILRGAGSA